MSESLISSFLVSDVSESLRSLTKNEGCERIAQVAHKNEWMSELLIRSFLGKRRAIRSEIRWANSQPCFPYIWMNACIIAYYEYWILC